MGTKKENQGIELSVHQMNPIKIIQRLLQTLTKERKNRANKEKGRKFSHETRRKLIICGEKSP